MRHLASPVLRRMVDEPFAVPDTARSHLAGCGRCQENRALAADDAARASELLFPETLTIGARDIDQAWAAFREHTPAASGSVASDTAVSGTAVSDTGLDGPAPGQSALGRPAGTRRPGSARRGRPTRRPVRVLRLSLGTGTAAVAGVLVLGAAAAATLTTVFAPTKVAPVPVTSHDLNAVLSAMDLHATQLTPGPTANGTRRLPFGTLSWTSAGPARPVTSLAQAQAATGLASPGPQTRPAGVGSPSEIQVQPKVTVTFHFNGSAGAVSGSTLVVTGGPAILVQYGGQGGSGHHQLGTMMAVSIRRPVATATGATLAQLENFLLSRPGVPAGLAQELRLLGSLRTVLPVPVPAGVDTQRLTIGGAPAVLIADPSGAASGVIWESPDGIVHGVAGLLDRQDVLNAARAVR
jgi:hypothetical protein